MNFIDIGYVLRFDTQDGVTTADLTHHNEIVSGDALTMRNILSVQEIRTETVEVLESRPARGNWKDTPPTWYKVQLIAPYRPE